MFNKGDILRGSKRQFHEAYHPIAYIAGQAEAPLAIVLTHTTTREIPCNLKLSGIYDGTAQIQYFVAHLIQKMSEWNPYIKVGELTREDMKLIEDAISGMGSITWEEYSNYKNNGCPIHQRA